MVSDDEPVETEGFPKISGNVDVSHVKSAGFNRNDLLICGNLIESLRTSNCSFSQPGNELSLIEISVSFESSSYVITLFWISYSLPGTLR